MIRLSAKVQGNVQGVGFRYWVHHTAQRLTGVGGGYVKNLSNGSVEVEAEVHERVTTLLGSALARNCHILVQPAKHAGEIGHVTVNVPMKNASPDLLWLVGFSLKDRSIDTDATMGMERSASRLAIRSHRS